jgi:quercetin 2,3-dioxygenase
MCCNTYIDFTDEKELPSGGGLSRGIRCYNALYGVLEVTMISVRKAQDRGHFDHGWLDTSHTFSFASYFDPRFMGFRSLRVINEDLIAPGMGFGTHGHRDMEIVTYVASGAIAHKDSLGTGSVIRPGEAQRMTAGTGVRHSEFNPSEEEPVHLLQIWIEPEREGLEPGYEQREFPASERAGRLRMIASRDGAEGSLTIHQDARIFATDLKAGDSVEHTLERGRHAWVQMVRGSATLNGSHLSAGDGAAISEEPALRLAATEDAEVLLFDLA